MILMKSELKFMITYRMINISWFYVTVKDN